MFGRNSRRSFLGSSLAVGGGVGLLHLLDPEMAYAREPESLSRFPATETGVTQEIVSVSHFNLDRVKELLGQDRSLATASWDWGYGDWESALGAASHVGRQDIAMLLIENGARPNLFTLAMMDKVDAVRACCEAMPGIQKVLGPHGITLLSHAKTGKAEQVVEYLTELGGADEGATSLPLSEEEMERYLGEYQAGEEKLKITVGKNRRGTSLTIQVNEGNPRGLLRTGDHQFSPAGAPQVQISFKVQEDAVSVMKISRQGTELISCTK